MQKQNSIYIPKPCHEDWNKMTPTQQGKFCSACNKQVVDFSLMSDNQILSYLSNQSGKVCGRFDTAQLERPLIETKIEKKKSWWMALAMPLLFLFDRSEAQKITLKQKHNVFQSVDTSYTLVGAVAIIQNERIISGSVVDENNNPLPFVSIHQKGTNRSTNTDSLGNFSVNVNFDSCVATIVASYIGYEIAESKVKINEPETIITMQPKSIILSDVIVTSSAYTTGKMVTLGGAIAICQKIAPIDTVKTSIKKAFNISAFKIYPNPVTKNSTINLKIKQAGKYELQLFDNQSRLVTVENISTYGNKDVSNFTLPSNIAAGIYYLRLINEQTKKTSTEKLIVQ